MKCEKCGIEIKENETLCENCKTEKSLQLDVDNDVQVEEVAKKKKNKTKKSPNSILANSIFALSSPIISITLFSILLFLTLFIQLILDTIFSPINLIPVIGQIVYFVIVILILLLLLVPFLVTAVFSLWAFVFSVGTIISSSHYKRRNDDNKLKMNVSKILAIIGLFFNAIIVFIALLPIIFSLIALGIIILITIIIAILVVIAAVIGVVFLFIYGEDLFAVFISMLGGLGEIAENITPMVGSLGQIAELISTILNILLIFI